MKIVLEQTPLVIADEDPNAEGFTVPVSTGGSFYSLLPNVLWFNTIKNRWHHHNGTQWVVIGGGDIDIQGSINAELGFLVGNDTGVDGQVEMARFGGGRVKLTFKKGIVTEIEDEA